MKKYNPLFFKSIILSIFIITFIIQGCSQTYFTKENANAKAKRMLDRGNEYLKNGVFEKAIHDFQEAIKIEPSFIDAHYQLSSAYFNQKNYENAKTALQKVVSLDSLYKPVAFHYLGIIYWELDDFENAASNFESFLKSSSSSKLKEEAEKLLQNSRFAIQAIKNPVLFQPKPLPATINTELPEYLPSVNAEGNLLVFSRRIGRGEDLYFSEKVNGEWQKAQPLDQINTENKEGSICISADGYTMVFNRFDDPSGLGSSDLFFSEKKNGIWTKPKNLGQPVNSKTWEAQPSLSADGKTLYFASDRIGGVGGMDIWRTQRNEKGEWGNPINLGKTINTTGNDESPFIHPDSKTLYFMSDGHPGMGGYDLFFSKREVNKWSTPKNLGYPINTKKNAGALFITLDSKTAYFTEDNLPTDDLKKQTSKEQPDIFTFELPEALRPTPVTYIKATVKDAFTKNKLEKAGIEVIDLSSGLVFTSSFTDLTGHFLTCLPIGGNYALNVNKEGYIFHSENFELLEKSNLKDYFLLEIELQPILLVSTNTNTNTSVEKREPIILKNVFFESGSAALKTSSQTELNHLRDLLNENLGLNIKIRGHTDSVGSEKDNLQLSDNRAKAVKEYLISQGIASNRLSHQGLGEGEPIDSNETEEGRKNNRRTEFLVEGS